MPGASKKIVGESPYEVLRAKNSKLRQEASIDRTILEGIIKDTKQWRKVVRDSKAVLKKWELSMGHLWGVETVERKAVRDATGS